VTALARLLDLDPLRLAELQQTLIARGETVAVAESLTGGLLTAVLTGTPGASSVVRGGLVVYATDTKHALAGVDGDLLDQRGAVDPEVAGQLAAGARRAFAATWGIGVTGVAGPKPQDGQPVGTVFCAVAGPDGRAAEDAAHHSGDRDEVRTAAIQQAIDLLITAIGEHLSGTPR
jgi:nicotinamide-nucleotide amidase